MKKFLLLTVIALLSLSACVPDFLGGGAAEAPAEAPAVDVAGTVDAEASTQAVQTLAVLATPTLEPATPTEEMPATATDTLAPTEENTATPEETADPPSEADAETTGTPEAGTDVTATLDVSATPEITETPAPTATSVYPSPTSPIAINMPPQNLVGYRPVEIRNRLKGKVYISFQGATEYDYRPVIEYDLPGFAKVRIHVPQGDYKIVVYVGKDPMIDYVTIHKNTNLVITIRKHSLRVEK